MFVKGRCSQNLERDLFRSDLYKLPIKPSEFYLDTHMPGEVGIQRHRFYCIPPHEMLRVLYGAGDIVLSTAVLGPSGKAGLAEFWDHVKGEEDYKDSPAYLAPTSTIPIFSMWMALRPPSTGS
jgi:hypothetical protein